MKNTIKRLGITIVVLTVIGGVSYAAYTYIPGVQKIFTPGYSDAYTFDEVNAKILKYQKQIAEEIKKELEKSISSSDIQRVKGDMEVSVSGESAFGGGGLDIGVGELDIQVDNMLADISIQDLKIDGSVNMMGETQSGTLSLNKMHFLTNNSGSYILLDTILHNFSDSISSQIPEELIVTLNTLGLGNRYIDLRNDDMFKITEASLKENSLQSRNIEDLIIGFIENENIFVVEKQEETKYYLTLSESVCKLIKFTEGASELNSIPSYEDFKKSEGCDNQEYTDFQNNLMNYEPDGEKIEKKGFYIELSETKAHIYMGYSYMHNYGVEGEDQEFVLEYEGYFELLQSLNQKVSLQMGEGILTGSGILVEQTGDSVNGYLDIDFTEDNGNIFNSDIQIAGTVESVSMSGGYMLETEERISSMIASGQGKKIFTGEINGSFTSSGGTIDVTQKFEMGENLETNGEISMRSTFNLDDTRYSGNMKIEGKIQMSKDTAPMSGEGNMSWNTQADLNKVSGDYNMDFDIPNIASGKYSLKYDFEMSDSVETKFESPENIVTQKSFDTLLLINARKLEKERKEKIKEKIQELKKGNYTFTDGEKMHYNSTINSDIRNIASAIEIHITKGGAVEDILSDSIVMDIPDENPFDYQNFNFYEADDLENQQLLNGNPNTSKLDIEIYDLNPPQVRILKSDKAFICFQVLGETISFSNTLERTIKGTCLQSSISNPVDLFDIDIEKTEQ